MMDLKYRSWQCRIALLLSIVGMLAGSSLVFIPPAVASIVKDDNSGLSIETGVPLYIWHDTSYEKPVAVLVAVHGSAQQAGSMTALANSLAKLGYYVIAPDIRGHGRWQLSKQADPATYDTLTQSANDLESILKLVQSKYPKTNIFCLGESIGVGIVLAAVAKSPKRVKGVILCSAGVQPHLHNPLRLGTDFVAGMARLVEPVDIRNYLSMYSSDDARVAEEMVKDPLGKNTQTGLELLGTFNFLHQEPELAAGVPPNVRALVIQGEADQVLEPSSAYQIFSALRTKKKKFLMVPGAGHVLVGTSFIKSTVLEPIQDWLSKNI